MTRIFPWTPSVDWVDHVPHRTPICESENLANVALPRLDYVPRHAHLHADGALSTFQYETVAYACQSLAECGAFLLGDATGTGKTRVMGAVAREHEGAYRVLWLSVNSRLMAEVNGEVRLLGGAPFEIINMAAHSSHLYQSYSGLLRKDVFDALRAWIGAGPSLLLIDEAHSCRNDTQTFHRVDALAAAASRVLYCTATAASSLRHLRYLRRLRLWGGDGPFASHSDLHHALRQSPVSSMELLCMQLKREGRYVAREISFDGVEVQFVRVPLDADATETYNYFVREFSHAARCVDRARFFQLLLVSCKLDAAMRLARDALARGMAPIISLQSTGEAAMKRGSTAMAEILCNNGIEPPSRWKHAVNDTLDVLLAGLGGPALVAEISGRSWRRTPAGSSERVPATASEVAAFQSGRKRIALLTRAGSTGISLHDEDGRRRCNIVLQLPWSSEEFLQQAGRCHRTNQRSAPVYMIVTTDVPGEARLIHCVASRLASLGALTHGDRRTHLACTAEPVADWTTGARRDALLKLFGTLMHAPGVAAVEGGDDLVEQIPPRGVQRDMELVRAVESATNHDPAWTEAQVAHAIRACRPDLAIHPPTWSRDTHGRFDHRTRQGVLTVLLCATRCEAATTLGALPPHLLDLVVSLYASDPHAIADAVAASCHAIRASGVTPSVFCNGSSEQAMNCVLAMPIDAQRTIARLVRLYARESGESPGVCDFDALIARPGLQFSVAGMQRVRVRAPSRDARDGLMVHVQAHADLGPELPDDVEVMQDVTCGDVVGVCQDEDGTADLWRPGSLPIRVSSQQWRFMNMPGRFRATAEARTEWWRRYRRHCRIAKARATRASRSYTFVIDDPLVAWPESKRRVVRLPRGYGIGVLWN